MQKYQNLNTLKYKKTKYELLKYKCSKIQMQQNTYGVKCKYTKIQTRQNTNEQNKNRTKYKRTNTIQTNDKKTKYKFGEIQNN